MVRTNIAESLSLFLAYLIAAVLASEYTQCRITFVTVALHYEPTAVRASAARPLHCTLPATEMDAVNHGCWSGRKVELHGVAQWCWAHGFRLQDHNIYALRRIGKQVLPIHDTVELKDTKDTVLMKEVIASLTVRCIIKQTRVVAVGVCEFLNNKKHPPLGKC